MKTINMKSTTTAITETKGSDKEVETSGTAIRTTRTQGGNTAEMAETNRTTILLADRCRITLAMKTTKQNTKNTLRALLNKATQPIQLALNKNKTSAP